MLQHAVGHFKDKFPTVLNFARNLGNSVYESIKRITSWAAYWFCQNSHDLQGLRHGDFQVFGSKWPQIRTTYLCRTQNTYGTLKGRYQVNLQEKINHNQNFSEFSETEAINLKKVASYFQDTIHFHPVHLQPKTLNFTIRALVE